MIWPGDQSLGLQYIDPDNNIILTTTVAKEQVYLMQFTGLKDKNGKEIYEGDILEFDADEWGGEDNIFQVQWDDANAMWETGGGTNGECESFKTIVGNIYQNPELLKP